MANTLKFGNGEWYGKKDTILAYNDENNNYKPLPFDFSRASSATRVNKDGLIETVGSGEPRIDFKDDAKGALLLEPQRSNTYLNSEPTTNESSMLGVTYESFNWVIGFTNCVKYGDNSATRYRYGGTISASTEYTLSAFVIMDDLSEPIIGGQTSDKDFSFVLGGSTVNPNSSVNMGNNIWRVSSTAITSALPAATNNGIIKYTAQSNKGFRVVGYQVEEGSYATSYIPTSGSVVTRIADVCNNAGNDQVFNGSEGAIFLNFASYGDYVISLDDGTSTNRIQFFRTLTNDRIYIMIGGTFIINEIYRGTSNGVYNKYALSYESGNILLYVNGVLSRTYATAFTSTPFTKFNLNQYDEAASVSVSLKGSKIYNTALTDQELIALTQV